MRRWFSAGFEICGALLICILPRSSNASAQDTAALAVRLHAAAEASSIDSRDLRPWHLKVDFQLFDAKSKPIEKGTVEEWWASPEVSRVTYTLPSYTGTQLHSKDGWFQTRSKQHEPVILSDLLEQVVNPMPDADEIDRAEPELRKQKFGNLDLDCIMLDQALDKLPHPPLGLFPTFCLDPGKNSLRLTTELGSLAFIRNRVGSFQGRSVVIDLIAVSDGIDVMSAHVTTLAGLALTDADFTATPDMEAVARNATVLTSAAVAPLILSQPYPEYPQSAKMRHVSGKVVMDAIIGRDGRIRSLHLVSASDPDFAISAIAAVRTWTYKPYTLNGAPTEVKTTVNVNFTTGEFPN